MPKTRIEQLKNAGIVKRPLEPKAQELINNLTDDEFHTILTVHAKISDQNHRTEFENQIHTMGF